MSQGTVIVANGTGATVRASINTAFDALVTSNSGASAPTTMSAYMLWADTTTGYLKIRNAANSAWVIAGRLANVGLGRVLNASLSKSATYTVVAADEGQFLQCSSTFTLSLTGAATLGDGFALAIANTGVGVITVDPAGSETIGGSATLTLAAGDAIVTMCNGSNWIVASNKISTLPVANGGTGVTTSTGTGAVVLSTSPALTTPALGTPASGVLTSCTGYAAANLPAGSVIQVVQSRTSTITSTTSTSYVDVTDLNATITPSSASNKILVLVDYRAAVGATDYHIGSVRLVRGSTVIESNAYGTSVDTGSPTYVNHGSREALNYLDSPNTTSATTYKLQISNYGQSGSDPYVINGSSATSGITLMEIKV